MRFYDIAITDTSGAIIKIGDAEMRFTSFKNGITTPGALNIEMDIPIFSEEIPVGNSYLKIWGISLEVINNAKKLNNATITIMAGMQKGLPLANLQANSTPPRNSTIFTGTVWQAFGNWHGTEQTLDLIITTQLTVDKAKPIIFNCPAKGSFSDAISQAMINAGIKATVNIDKRLVASEPIVRAFQSVRALAYFLDEEGKKGISDQIYLGIKVVKTTEGYSFTDNSVPGIAKTIDFTDLIGQPAWQAINLVRMNCVLRSDIHVADTIKFPENTNLKTTAKSNSNLKDGIAYTGTAFVSSVRHIGNFRQADANDWVTVIEVIPNLQSVTTQ